MPVFNIRMWQEQTLFACRDYAVTAKTLAEAAKLMWQLQQTVNETDDRIIHEAVTPMNEWAHDGDIVPLNPEDIVAGDEGMTLIDAKGKRLRDLSGVPTGCRKLGQPLKILDE